MFNYLQIEGVVNKIKDAMIPGDRTTMDMLKSRTGRFESGREVFALQG